MLHIESEKGRVEIEASGTTENITNDAINAMDGLIKSISEEHGDEVGTILAAFMVTALGEMWGKSREGFFAVAMDAAKYIHVSEGKPPEESDEKAEDYAGVKA